MMLRGHYKLVLARQRGKVRALPRGITSKPLKKLLFGCYSVYGFARPQTVAACKQVADLAALATAKHDG